MADRYRPVDIPIGPLCPTCNHAYMVWDRHDGRFTTVRDAWSCVCGHQQDSVHWLTPGATRRLHIQPDTFGDDPVYVERYDVMSGKSWWQREINGASYARKSRRGRIYQVAYTNEQYELVRWSLWMYDRGWTNREIYDVVKHFWMQQLGQTPLVSRKVFIWVTHRSRMMKRGLEWP